MKLSIKIRYFLRIIIQKFLTITNTIFLHEFFKKLSGHNKRQLSQKFFEKKIQKKIKIIDSCNLSTMGNVLEQGTGWHGLDLIIFYLCGSNKIYSYDTSKWLKKELLLKSINASIINQDKIREVSRLDESNFHKRINELQMILFNKEEISLEIILEKINISYYVVKSFEYEEVENNTIDLFYSDSVLQRVLPNGLIDIVNFSYNKLSRHGLSFHIVDSKDFHSIDNKNIPELEYLILSSKMYNFISSQYLNYQNRLRMSEFVDLFTSRFKKVKIFNKIIDPKNLNFVKRNIISLDKYKNFIVEDIAVSRFMLKTKKHN